MKVKKQPLPTPWTADTAVLHLYRVWSNQGRVQLHQITLSNPNTFNALLSLWERTREPEWHAQCNEVASGILVDIGPWRLFRGSRQTGMIVIEHTPDVGPEGSRRAP